MEPLSTGALYIIHFICICSYASATVPVPCAFFLFVCILHFHFHLFLLIVTVTGIIRDVPHGKRELSRSHVACYYAGEAALPLLVSCCQRALRPIPIHGTPRQKGTSPTTYSYYMVSITIPIHGTPRQKGHDLVFCERLPLSIGMRVFVFRC